MSTFSRLQHQHFKFQLAQRSFDWLCSSTGGSHSWVGRGRAGVHRSSPTPRNNNTYIAWVKEQPQCTHSWTAVKGRGRGVAAGPGADGSTLRCAALNTSFSPTSVTFEEEPATVQVRAGWETARVEVPTHPPLTRTQPGAWLSSASFAVQQTAKDTDNWWRWCLLRARRIAVSWWSEVMNSWNSRPAQRVHGSVCCVINGVSPVTDRQTSVWQLPGRIQPAV